MEERFPIFDISTWSIADDEPMGTKPKFWVREPDHDEWLWKRKSRINSDDDWTEKAAAELAELLGIPHAHVELARFGEQRGIISRNIVKDWNAVELIHGNQLLWEVDPGYSMEGFYHNAQHTLDRVFRVLEARSIKLPFWNQASDEIATSPELFLGYLLFDAWIGNSDRHHENWAALKYRDDSFTLAPSYDHASSLGHNVQDEDR